ncbi:GNAT family N-acetyltransferase [Thermogymnomonas acidicola]|nr:GNAT family N-acetyltransferase [Thermogymnomonas acidicola]
MELSNIKLDWDAILGRQISHLESIYPDMQIRDQFRAIINLLNSNRIKSRVILSGINVAAYGFFMDSSEMRDRSFATVGFTDPAFANEQRLRNIVEWIVGSVSSSGRMTMMNEVFQDNGISGPVLASMGFRKITRVRMEYDLADNKPGEPSLPREISVTGLEGLDIRAYSSLEYECYRGTQDEILLASSEEDRLAVTRNIFSGSYGNVLQNASYLAFHKASLIGAVVCTDGRVQGRKDMLPTILNVFVKPEYRGNGLGTALMQMALSSLRGMGFFKAYLWVTEGNRARDLYSSLGFTESRYPREVIYYRK